MKTLLPALLILLFVLLAINASADECTPKTCEEKLAIAKRQIVKLKKELQELKDTPPKVETVTKVRYEYVALRGEPKPNILSLVALSSYFGLNTKVNGNSVEVIENRSAGFGLMYQHLVAEDLYLGLGIDTNQGGNVNLGFGF